MLDEREFCDECGEFRNVSHLEPGIGATEAVVQCHCQERDERRVVVPAAGCGSACYGWDWETVKATD